VSNLGLYLASVVIWGSTWIAITFQLGRVPAAVSVAYRFALASLVLLLWARLRRLSLRFSGRDHLAMAAQGLLLFGANYVCVYLAEGELPSGLVAVIFSLMAFLNIFGARLFLDAPVRRGTLVGAVLGVGGVALVFLPELHGPSGKGRATVGLAFALAATVSASLGNIVSARNQRRGLPVVQLNAYGMLYGALFVGAFAVATGQPFRFDPSPAYLLSLLYLAVFGSVIAFGAYLTLLGRVGADRAGYTSVAIPMVALLVSTAFEGLRWHAYMVVGMALCVAGNVLVLARRRTSGAAPPRPAHDLLVQSK
jgi:drug/metabolite transporter (DMT)-like permease